MPRIAKNIRDQSIALPLALVICAVLIGLLRLEISILNNFTAQKLSLHIRLSDLLVGLTVYLKTSVDFAVFIGRKMAKNPGLKGRIGIETGTAVGNAIGTMAILFVWTFFKEVNWLLAIMIAVAALVLVRLAEDGLEHIQTTSDRYPAWFTRLASGFKKTLRIINQIFAPLLTHIIPSSSLANNRQKTFRALLISAFTVPFVLGLDDFAGYVPLFSVVNVFGFASGVLLGHMILNIFLYLSPKRTIKTVENPFVSLVGSVAFVILAVWALLEAAKLLLGR